MHAHAHTHTHLLIYTLWGVKSATVPSQGDTMLGEPSAIETHACVPMPTYFKTLLANWCFLRI